VIRAANTANMNQRLPDTCSLEFIDQVVLFQKLLAVVRVNKQFKSIPQNLRLVVVSQLVLLPELGVGYLRLSIALSALLLVILQKLPSQEQIGFGQLLHAEF